MENIRKSKKAITIVICFIISLLINTISIASLNMPVLAKAIDMAETQAEEGTGESEGTDTPTTNEEDKFLELRAVEVKDVVSQGKQVIMELWANDIDFEGFDVRFTYDNTKIKPSNMDTNVEVTDLSNILEYFRWEDEFYNSDITGPLDVFSNQNDLVRMIVSFYPPAGSASTHIVDKGDGHWTVLGSGGVKLGKMSFQMTADEFDATWFNLVARTESDEDYVPEKGIDINIDGNEANTLKEEFRFRFTDQTSAKNADLTGITVSKEKENAEEPSTPIYQEYNLDPVFNKETKAYTVTLLEYIDDIDIKAKLSDEKATMKIKVPKRSEETGELVYEEDGTTISYEEKELLDDTNLNVVLNELGKPDTIITITVTAEDGKTTNEYTVTIHRPYGTIKGSIQLGAELRESMETTYGNTVEYIADISAYNAGEFNWEGITEGETFLEELEDIELQRRVVSEPEQGLYTMYIIPGDYDILIERLGFLAQIVTQITINEGDEIDLGERILIEGDVNRDGLIDVVDLAEIMDRMDSVEGDDIYDTQGDFGQKGFTDVLDMVSVLDNMDKLIEVEKYM